MGEDVRRRGHPILLLLLLLLMVILLPSHVALHLTLSLVLRKPVASSTVQRSPVLTRVGLLRLLLRSRWCLGGKGSAGILSATTLLEACLVRVLTASRQAEANHAYTSVY